MKRYGENLSPSFGVYSSTLGDGLTATQSSMDNGWKWKTSSSTNLVSSGVALSRSTHRNKFVSVSKVGIRNISMFLLCKRPCVVNTSERIMETALFLDGLSCQPDAECGAKPTARQGLFGLIRHTRWWL